MFPLPDPAELQTSLWRDLLDRWFPACIDPGGGYRQNFDAEFRTTGDASKGLVFQSRMIWVCASVADQRPDFADHAQHGIRFLRDRLLDRRTGAFAWSTNRPEERHAYGLSFAIYALAAAGRHLGDEEALDMAKNACTYLEAYHHDEIHGGYFEVTTAAGEPILDPNRRHAIGPSCAQKSQNTHLHLMEAYTELYRAWPDPLVRERLEELLGLFCGHDRPLYVEDPTTGHAHLALFVGRDWTPASTDTSYGHDIEAAHLMIDAAAALYPSGYDEQRGVVLHHALSLGENVLAKGWDEENGGIFYTGDDNGPTGLAKNWWAEAEALLGFATLWKETGDERFRRATAETWAFIRDHQIDRLNGGWFEEAHRPDMPKGHAWKAAYHDGRALLFTERLLRSNDSG